MEVHYATGLHSQHITDIQRSTGITIIDPGIDQFCSEQARHNRTATALAPYSELPRVAILPPDDPRRPQWYHDPTTTYKPDREYCPQQ